MGLRHAQDLPHSRISQQSLKVNLLLCLLIFIFGLVAYLPILSSDFLGDDLGRIYFNFHIYKQGFWAVLVDTVPERPVLFFTIWLEALLWGSSPMHFKLVNVLLHCATSIAFGFYASRILKGYVQSQSPFLLLAAIIFAVHPLNFYAVDLIVQRGVILAGLFGILSLIFLDRGLEKTSNRDFLISVIFFGLSLLSKTNGIIILVIAFLFTRKQTLPKYYFPLLLSLLVLPAALNKYLEQRPTPFLSAFILWSILVCRFRLFETTSRSFLFPTR